MSIKNSGLLVLMMTFSLVNFAYAINEQPFRVVNMNDIADEGNQNVKFINKKGNCYYFGQALLVSVQNEKNIWRGYSWRTKKQSVGFYYQKQSLSGWRP